MDMGIYFGIFEIIGTVAFAASGAMEAIRHKMDLFGVLILGVITAVGGGVMRDIVIGSLPPSAFLDPFYAALAIAVGLAVFVLTALLKGRGGAQAKRIFDVVFFFADTLGLAAFTVLGIGKTSLESANAALLIFVGVITGVGGGVLRDVFAGIVPSVFRKHVYATASIIGAVLYITVTAYTDLAFSKEIAMTVGFLSIVIIRILAATFKWNLPHISLNENSENKTKDK